MPYKSNSSRNLYSLTLLGLIVCSLGAFFYGYEYILRITPSVMVPELQNFFLISARGIGILIGLYYIAYTPMQLLVGPILDLYGPRYVLFLAVMTCVMGNFLFGNAHSIWLAGTGRFLTGLGSAFAFVGAMKLAANWLPKNRFALYSGLVTATAMFLGITGDLGLTALNHHIGWQNTILLCTAIGVILIPMMWAFIYDSQKGKHHTHSFNEIWKGFWVVVRNSQIWLSGLIACMLFLALSGFAEMWGIPFLRASFNFSPQQAALANSMIFFGWLVGGPLFGWISDYLNNRRIPLMIGGLGGGICFAIVLYAPVVSFVSICSLLLLFGLFTSAEVICFAIGRDTVSKKMTATAFALINMITMMSGFICQPLIGTILDVVWHYHATLHYATRIYTTNDFRIALGIIPLAMFLSVIFAFLVQDPMRKNP